MNPPTAMTRWLGTPRVAAAMYVGGLIAVLGWFGGAVPWWLAIIAVCFLGTVKKAINDVRRYDQWRAQWDAMAPGSASAPAATPKAQVRRRKPSSRWTGVIAAALLLFPIIPFLPLSATSEAARNALTLLWLATALYLVCKLVLNLRPARASLKAAPASPAQSKNTGPATDVVEWVLPRASSSPSRADIMRQLPEHCMRLMA